MCPLRHTRRLWRGRCPTLADGLLAAKSEDAGHDLGEMLRELQLLLASLRYSGGVAYSPHGFCAAFRDFEGRPLAAYEQRDADEFLHELLQRIEEALGPKHPLLDSLFGGALAQQVLWTDAAGKGQTSERSEPFRALQLEIGGHETIEAALEAYVSGEPICGYVTPEGVTVDALKRVRLGKLPHTLIVQLKRFEFDYDAMVKVRERQPPPPQSISSLHTADMPPSARPNPAPPHSYPAPLMPHR